MRLAPTAIADAFVPQDRLERPQEVFPLDLALCRACAHFQLLDAVDPKALFSDYIYVSASSPGLIEHFRQAAQRLAEKFKPAAGALAIDIGSNDGALLRFLKERGLRVLGVDPAREIARKTTESGIQTLPEFFSSGLARKMRAEFGAAALITANNVFAHSDQLADMADGVAALLAPDGVFVFEVSYLVDLMQQMVFDSVYHEHLSYHSVKPLQSFLRLHGLELIEVERVTTKGGSLRATAQLAGGPRPVSPAVAELLALEEKLGLSEPATFRAFAADIEQAKAQLLKLLTELKAQGKTIAGYGASPTVTTLLYHFDLSRFVDFIVDDNPLKHGLFSPGHHIPVFPSAVLYERKPDYVIVLAWRFAGLIVKKHQAFLDQGGHFIVPLPKLEVL